MNIPVVIDGGLGTFTAASPKMDTLFRNIESEIVIYHKIGRVSAACSRDRSRNPLIRQLVLLRLPKRGIKDSGGLTWIALPSKDVPAVINSELEGNAACKLCKNVK